MGEDGRRVFGGEGRGEVGSVGKKKRKHTETKEEQFKEKHRQGDSYIASEPTACRGSVAASAENNSSEVMVL